MFGGNETQFAVAKDSKYLSQINEISWRKQLKNTGIRILHERTSWNFKQWLEEIQSEVYEYFRTFLTRFIKISANEFKIDISMEIGKPPDSVWKLKQMRLDL